MKIQFCVIEKYFTMTNPYGFRVMVFWEDMQESQVSTFLVNKLEDILKITNVLMSPFFGFTDVPKRCLMHFEAEQGLSFIEFHTSDAPMPKVPTPFFFIPQLDNLTQGFLRVLCTWIESTPH